MNRTRLLVVVGVWLVILAALQVSNARPSPIVLGGIVFALAALVLASRDLFTSARAVVWSRPKAASSVTRSNDPHITWLCRQSVGVHQQSGGAMTEMLIEIIDDRLLAHHGVDRAVHPEHAKALLSASLQRIVADPYRPLANVRELQRIVADIESL